MDKILGAGADIYSRSDSGNSAFLCAANGGHIEGLRLLLGTGRIDMDKDFNNDGEFALHWAAYHGRHETLRFLIEHGAEVNVRAKDGRTPLHTAVRQNLSTTVSVLLEYGADPLAVIREGASAIDLAVADSLVDILRLLGNVSRSRVRSFINRQRCLVIRR